MKRYACSYQFDGGHYAITIPAASWQEASARMRAIGMTGSVDGELAMEIPVTPRSWWQTLFGWRHP